jgi:asparagine synthetase B (glutamine-hydrolysing)
MIIEYSLKGSQKSKVPIVHLKGYVTINERTYVEGYLTPQDQQLLQNIFQEIENKTLSPKQLSGNFTLVFEDMDQLKVCTDRIGSQRLFYFKHDEYFCFASNFFELLYYLKDKGYTFTRDRTAVAEIFCFLYAFNDRTVVKEIKEMKPASFYTISKRGVDCDRYWTWREKQSSTSYAQALQYAQSSLEKVYQEMCSLISVVGGPAYISLSGGADSRLVLSMLENELPLKDINAIILGQLSSHDVRIAYKIAIKLGLTIRHFPLQDFSELLALRKYESEIMHQMNGSNIGGINVLPLLQSKNAFVKGCYFNGHMGDILGGSHLSLKEWLLFLKGNYSRDEFVFRAFRKHCIFHSEKFKKEIQEEIQQDLYDYFERSSGDNNLDILEQFDIEHRQRKFIINDSRGFASIGLIPIVPLAQKDFIDCFSFMDNRYRYGSRLYNDLKYQRFKSLGGVYMYAYGDSVDIPEKPKETMFHQVLSDLNKFAFQKLNSKIHRYISKPPIPNLPDGKVYYMGLDGYYEVRNEKYLEEIKEIANEFFTDFSESHLKSFSSIPVIIPQIKYVNSLL